MEYILVLLIVALLNGAIAYIDGLMEGIIPLTLYAEQYMSTLAGVDLFQSLFDIVFGFGVSSLTDQTVDPPTMAEWAYQNGYWCSGNGSYHSLIPGAAEGFGLQWESISTDDPQAVVDTLASGKLIVALMSKGHFTSSGHFMVLRGVTSEGKILVADPASKKRSEQEWDISIILDEARKGAAAGGPLWAIY